MGQIARMLNRRITRKQTYKKQVPTNFRAKYSNLHYIGSGSYGSVYEIKNTGIALKEHRIINIANSAFCEDWKHEFDIQQAVYIATYSSLTPLSIGIAKPFEFSYGRRNETNILTTQKDLEGATACFFTMERVPAFYDAPTIYRKKLYKLLKPLTYLHKTVVPPYLQLASLQHSPGHISLDMIQGSSVVEFPNEAYNYALTEGVSLDLCKNTFLSFFVIADHGFVPRDIEYLFNGDNSTTFVKIIDFNEVKTAEERAKGRGDYDFEEDLAHVYIDLCGLRSVNTKNPQAPYDVPTPQWKFLCSPLITPHAFFTCLESVKKYPFRRVNIEKVTGHLLDYLEKRLTAKKTSIPWEPTAPYFSYIPQFEKYDTLLQKYYLTALFETATKRSIHVNLSFATYEEGLLLFQTVLAKPLFEAEEDDWDFPFSENPGRKDLLKRNEPVYRKQKFTLKR